MQALLENSSDKLLSAMPDVKTFERQLASLNDWWGKIALIGKINSHNVAATILDDMNQIQGKFGELQKKLTYNLLLENVQKLVLDNASKAQVAIDLLVRNLFERTADVGFLATDDDIRAFLSLAAPTAEQTAFIEDRLREYVKKYSVYDEILVLDTQGRVKAHLDKHNPVTVSSDPLISETLTGGAAYVETFRYSDLQPDRRHSLIYSCQITETNQRDSKLLGVLCLCFKFDDEMRGIFADLLGAGDDGILGVLGDDGRVIASSDELLLPVNTWSSVERSVRIARYHGAEYIINTRASNGYQGFRGLGWCGQMMTALNQAFSRDPMAAANQPDIMEQASSFPPELRDIRKASAAINDDLGLLVLNGQIASARKNAAEFMPVLEAIKQIGTDIASIFTASVNSLQQATVMSSHLNNAGFLASLAVDIMDRNLYERANDCRWWALTSAFRRHLAAGSPDAGQRREIADILQYINALYTVYTNLYVYDANGDIVAVSDPNQQALVGGRVGDDSGAVTALKCPDSQSYRVSPFARSALYAQRPTYIYNAAITDLADTTRVVGGIGIVFDSEPQFAAMLSDVLPRDEQGSPVAGCFALFADRQKRVIATAGDSDLGAGELLDLDGACFRLPAGQRESRVVQYRERNYLLGSAVSKGYREYKVADGYVNDVIAFIFIPF
ncbi:cache domain-containing protein [Methylomonas sp. MV1]|nr:cache domain-containing protein [Methylomonas sp. MV1]MDT4329689.1 cache domain-containing protein [Methylomonas sp. MV1]